MTVSLPEPAMRLHGKRGRQITPEAMDWYTADQMHARAAAVSAADNVALTEAQAYLMAQNKALREALMFAMRWGSAMTEDDRAKCYAALGSQP